MGQTRQLLTGGRTSRRLAAACAAALVAALLGAGPTPAASATVVATTDNGTWPGTTAVCPNEIVVVARGSGEAPQSNPLEVTSYTENTRWGLGTPGGRQAAALWRKADNRDLSLRKQGAVYAATPVPDRLRQLDPFLQSVKGGADAIYDAVAAYIEDPAWCPQELSVHLVGYSQGAWSVRIATRRLWKDFGDNCCHGAWFLGSVTLFGDPTYDSKEEIVRWGHKPILWGHDTGLAYLGIAEKRVPKSWYAPYPAILRQNVSSYCLKDDLVCRTPKNWEDLAFKLLALKWDRQLDGHLSYDGDVLDAAAKFAARRFKLVPEGMKAFAQEVLYRAELGDTDWLWSVWGDSEFYWPEDLVADVNGSPGHIDSCGYYGSCLAFLASDPSMRWALNINGTNADGFTVNDFYGSPGQGARPEARAGR